MTVRMLAQFVPLLGAIVAAGLIEAGVRRHRPVRALAWRVVGLSMVALCAAAALAAVPQMRGGSRPVLLGLYLVGLAVAILALWRVLRDHLVGLDRETALDTAIVSLVIGIGVWDLVLDPRMTAAGAPAIAHAAVLAGAVLGAAAVAYTGRVLLTAAGRSPHVWRLLVAALLGLAGIVGDRLVDRVDGSSAGWVLALWSCSYLVAGTAALDPSIGRVAPHAASREIGWGRMVVLCLTLPTVLVLAVIHDWDHGVAGALVLVTAVVSTVVAFLWRCFRLVADRAEALRQLDVHDLLARSVLDSLTAHTVVVAADGTITAVNRAWDRFAVDNDGSVARCGLAANYLEVCDQATGPDSEEAAAVAAGLRGVLSGSIPEYQLEYPCDSPTSPRWFSLRITPHQGGTGAVLSHLDVTSQHDAAEELRRRVEQQATVARLGEFAMAGATSGELATRAAALVRDALETDMASVLALDDDGQLAQLGAAGWLDGSRLEVIPTGRDALYGAVIDADEPVVIDDLATSAQPSALLTGAGVVSLAAVAIRRRGGTHGILAAYSRVPRRFSAQDLHFVASMAYVLAGAAERTLADAELVQQASHDPSSGLPNRTSLARWVDTAPKPGTALLLIDVHSLQTICESLGRAAADRLFCAVAARADDTLPSGSLIARFSRDVLAVLLIGGEAVASTVAEELLEIFVEPFVIGEGSFFLQAHVGLAAEPHDTPNPPDAPERQDTPEGLLRWADLAICEAQRTGQRTCWYGPGLGERTRDELILETDLRSALARGDLTLHYQPQVSISTGCLVGLEALLRWHHPVRGPVSPVDFIPIAERTGLIVDIDRWVLDSACQQLGAWRASGITVPRVAVNVSATSVRCTDLWEEVRAVLERTGLDGNRLEIEITEHSLMGDSERAAVTFEALRHTGARLAIDDFGTGHSSLSYLQHFTFDTLKVDRAFVSCLSVDTATHSTDFAILKAILAMATHLGVEVVAEGVETTAQLQWLRLLGCDLAQGYLYSRPLDPLTLEELLLREAPTPLGIYRVEPSRELVPGD